MWYLVQPDDDMIYVAAIHEIRIKTLADLNPEISFNLCDFGEVYGGPECTVQLFETSEGSRACAHADSYLNSELHPAAKRPRRPLRPPFNAPVAQSPAHEAFFSPNEQVTLRWVGTGTLEAGQVYRVTVTNTDTVASVTLLIRQSCSS